MKEFKGTKGEWKVAERVTNGTKGYEIHWSEDGECVTDHVYDFHDANLIASAPELLKELQESNKDLIILHGHILSELKKGNTQWEGVDEIIYQRIEENKKAINKAL